VSREALLSFGYSILPEEAVKTFPAKWFYSLSSTHRNNIPAVWPSRRIGYWAVKLIVTLWEDPLYAAVSEPVKLDLIAKAVIVNAPVAVPAGITAIRGAATFGRELLSAIMVAALTGAESVTVQWAVVYGLRVVGVHCREEITVAADRLKDTLIELPL
jgi:hypothetical protein